MLKNLADKTTQDIYDSINSRQARKLPRELHDKARRLLDRIYAAPTLDMLRIPPTNRLEKLKADRAGFWSLRINDQWRIVFRWQAQDVLDVHVIDYHSVNDMLPKKRLPTHPGELLLKEFLEPPGLTRKAFAAHLGWTCARRNEVINGRRQVSADSALVPGEALKTGPEFWLHLQRDRDLWHAMDSHRKAPPLKNVR
jgi:addiction module HigA family antidote